MSTFVLEVLKEFDRADTLADSGGFFVVGGPLGGHTTTEFDFVTERFALLNCLQEVPSGMPPQDYLPIRKILLRRLAAINRLARALEEYRATEALMRRRGPSDDSPLLPRLLRRTDADPENSGSN